MSTLEIRNLHAQVLPSDESAEPKEILKGVNLTINSGEIHAIMGPNGSGKSTLAYTLGGHPRYEVTAGEVLLDGENILEMEVDERARAGLFLAMQYPTEIPGVSVANFLRSAATAIRMRLLSFASGLRKSAPLRKLWQLTLSSPTAQSTKVSPVARRSATRFCSLIC